MRSFLQPIVREVGQAIANEASKASKRNLPDIITISITIILTLIAAVGCVMTVYMYLSEKILDRHAMLLVTLIVLFLAFVSGSMARKIMMEEKKVTLDDEGDKPSNNGRLQNDTVATLGFETAKLIGQHPKNAAMIAMAMGVAMGVSPELRKAVINNIVPKE